MASFLLLVITVVGHLELVRTKGRDIYLPAHPGLPSYNGSEFGPFRKEEESRVKTRQFGEMSELGKKFLKCVREKEKAIEKEKNVSCAQKLIPTDTDVHNSNRIKKKYRPKGLKRKKIAKKFNRRSKGKQNGKGKQNVKGKRRKWKTIKGKPGRKNIKRAKHNSREMKTKATKRKTSTTKREKRRKIKRKKGNKVKRVNGSQERLNKPRNRRRINLNEEKRENGSQERLNESRRRRIHLNEEKRERRGRKGDNASHRQTRFGMCGDLYQMKAGDKMKFKIPKSETFCEMGFEASSDSQLGIKCNRFSIAECSEEYLFVSNDNEEKMFCGKKGPSKSSGKDAIYIMYERLREKKGKSKIYCFIKAKKKKRHWWVRRWWGFWWWW